VIYRDSLENVVGSLCSLFFIGQYIVACVLLPADLLSVGKSWQGFLVSILEKNWKAIQWPVVSLQRQSFTVGI